VGELFLDVYDWLIFLLLWVHMLWLASQLFDIDLNLRE